MRPFNFSGAILRMPLLLAAASTLAQAGPWQPVGKVIINQAGQSLSLKGNVIASFTDMELGFRIDSGDAPAEEPRPFPKVPIVLAQGQTLTLYYRFSHDGSVAGSDLIVVTDAYGVSCGDLAVEVKPSGATLDRAKVSAAAMGLAEPAPGVATVGLDGSMPEAVVFGPTAGPGATMARGAVETKGSPAAARGAVETKESPAAAGLPSSPGGPAPGVPMASAAAVLDGGDRKDLPRTLVIGGKPRERVKCMLSLGDSGRELIMTDAGGRSLKFGFEPVQVPELALRYELPVDLIGDISGSMTEPLAKDKERGHAVPRSVAHEVIYRAVRKKFPVGLNRVFDSSVRPWNMEGTMPAGGSTSLTECLRACRSGAITVVLTDDKDGVQPREAFAGDREKLIVTCLLTAFDLDVEYDPAAAAKNPGQAGINSRYRFATGAGRLSSGAVPGFGVAMMGQRDALPLIRVDTAYDPTGMVSGQTEIVGRIAAAVEHARTAKFWRITNPTPSEVIIHCPSGRSVCILPGTHTTIAPDPTDLKGFSLSNVYIHSPKPATEKPAEAKR